MRRPEEEGTVGTDIEIVAPRSRYFLEDFYTDEEQMILAILPEDLRPRAATVFWCIKEAVLKARRTGLKHSAKSVEVRALDFTLPQAWRKASVDLKDGPAPEVWWRLSEDHSMAMAIARLSPALNE